MLSTALDEIHRGYQLAADRRNRELRRRAGVRQVDAFLLQVENIIENQMHELPAELMDEIVDFVRPLNRKLLRTLIRNVTRDPVRVLDVLFDVQQVLMPRPAVVAQAYIEA
jgi:hypothetical protein